MKITYNLTKKEFRHYLNLALGIMHNKKRFLKHQKISSYTDICFKNLFLVLLIIPLINFLDTFKETEIISVILVLVLFFILLVSGIYILIGIKYISMCQVVLKGEIEFLEDEIVSRSVKGKISKKSWKYIDFIAILEEVILIFSKEKTVFLIPNIDDNKVILDKALRDYNLNIDIYNINYSKKNRWLIYGFILLLSFISSFKWDKYNINILEENYINNRELKNKTYGKYAILEKEIRYYYSTWQNNYDIYLDNSAINTFKVLTIDFLTNHKDELVNILNDLDNRKEKTNWAILDLIDLLDEKIVLNRIKHHDLGSFYDNLFLDYTVNRQSDTKEEWKKEIEINKLKSDYLKGILNILIKDNTWVIEDNNLYFYNESDLKEYNHLYDLIMESNKGIKF